MERYRMYLHMGKAKILVKVHYTRLACIFDLSAGVEGGRGGFGRVVYWYKYRRMIGWTSIGLGWARGDGVAD